jgi:LL-diaminopimelate aminotransferase
MTQHARESIRADRLKTLPPYLFAEIDRKKRAKREAGKDVIDLGVGDPDRPTPAFIMEAMEKAIRDPAWHRYPPGNGIRVFRQSAARFMERRFGVKVDPDRHITMCIGSKDGIAHLPLATVNPGDVVLNPVPGYPVYRSGAIFAGAEVVDMPLRAENGWLPDFDAVPAVARERARLVWTNYPNNPVAASADVAFYERLFDFCGGSGGGRGTIAVSDQAYSEIWFDEPPVSLWQARNAELEKSLGIEFHSLSKTFNMTGWRIAFAVGHPEVIAALAALKENCDSGQFGAVQIAGAAALDHVDHPEVLRMRDTYRERRDAAVAGLRDIGCDVEPPGAGFFVWARCPERGGRPMESMEFATRCLEEADVVLVPGAGFGETGRNFFRIALTVEVERIRAAVERMKNISW